MRYHAKYQFSVRGSPTEEGELFIERYDGKKPTMAYIRGKVKRYQSWLTGCRYSEVVVHVLSIEPRIGLMDRK